MKNRLLNLIDGFSNFISSSLVDSRKTFYELSKINYKESAAFIHQNGGSAVLLTQRTTFLKHAIEQIPKTGAILEFGVFKGESINYLGNLIQKNGDQRLIYGFDSFEGLSEDWSGTEMLQSKFHVGGNLPKVPENVRLVKGWVDETFPPFVKENLNLEEKIAFLHMDMDTYTPTKVVFENTVHLLKPGTIIVFDELLGYPGWKDNEYKALMEVLFPKWNFEFIAFCEPQKKYRKTSPFVRASLRILEPKI